jgi:hypothetical protein
MNRLSKLKIGFYLAAIFVAGLVTGAFITFQVGKHMMPNKEKMVRHWSEDLQAKLSLTPEQVQRIEPIILETLEGFKIVLAQDALTALSNCNARIALEISPEQKLKLEQMEQEQRGFIWRKFGGQATTNAP